MIVLQETTTTSGTITGNNTQQDVIIIHNAGATVTLTIAFPSTPINGQTFSISSVGGITTLTMSSGTTILNGLTSMAAGGVAKYIYSSGFNSWIKID